MPAIALTDVLTDFGPRIAAPPAVVASAAAAVGSSPVWGGQKAAPIVPPKPDVGEIVAAEVKRAESALELRLMVEHGAAMEAEREKHAAEMTALAESFGSRAGEAISTRLGQLDAQAIESVSTAVARVLATVVGEDIRRRTLDSLAAAVTAAFAGGEAVRVSAVGPAPMLSALRTALGEKLSARLDATESEGTDITLDIDGSVIETRLAEWGNTLAEILA